jgi:hypothetical protein
MHDRDGRMNDFQNFFRRGVGNPINFQALADLSSNSCARMAMVRDLVESLDGEDRLTLCAPWLRSA